MSGVQDKINSIKTFFNEVIGEMKKCSWPERRELVESTIVVIVSVFLLCVFVGISDTVLVKLLKAILPTG